MIDRVSKAVSTWYSDEGSVVTLFRPDEVTLFQDRIEIRVFEATRRRTLMDIIRGRQIPIRYTTLTVVIVPNTATYEETEV